MSINLISDDKKGNNKVLTEGGIKKYIFRFFFYKWEFLENVFLKKQKKHTGTFRIYLQKVLS